MKTKQNISFAATRILFGTIIAILAILLLLVYLPSKASDADLRQSDFSQDAYMFTPTLQFITSFGGENGDMVVEGNRAYVGNGTQLIIYEWYPTPAQYGYQGILHLPGAIHQLQVRDGILYVADGSGGFRMYSTTAPYPLLYYTTDGLHVRGFFLDGGFAYLNTNLGYSTRLVILDLSTPTAPSVRGETDAYLGETLFKDGDYLYSGYAVVDVSNPDAPAAVAQFTEPLVEISPPFAFTAVFSCGILGCDGDTFIYDISTPTNPTQVSNPNMMDSKDVLVSGSLAYFLADGLYIMNIADPANPALVGQYPIYAHTMDLQESVLYLATYDRLVILDVSNPAAPVWVGATDALGILYDMTISAPQAFFRVDNNNLAFHEFFVFDIHILSNPTQVAHAHEWSVNSVQDLEVFNGVGYILLPSNTGTPQFQTFDLTNIASPVLLGGYGTGLFASTLQRVDERVYIRSTALEVFDVSDSAHPALLTSYGNSLIAAQVLDNHLGLVTRDEYTAVGRNQILEIVDFSQPFSPTLVSTCTVAQDESLYAFHATGEYALFGLSDDYAHDELRIVDISSLVSPTLAGSYTPASPISTLLGSGKRVYLATSERFEILDITNPLTPTLLGAYPIAGWANQLLLQGELVYLSLANQGVLVLDVSDPAAPRVVAEIAAMPQEITVDGGLLYIAGSEGVQVLGLYPPAVFFPLIEVGNP